MLDFKELPQDGNDFELLIRELLFKMGFRVYWSGKGPDGGRDLLCVEEYYSSIMPSERKWLIQCKHTAHSERAVGTGDLDDIVDSCVQHDATGYLLVCSTYPSSSVVNRLEGISKSRGGVAATYWDSVTIERLLKTPQNWPIAQRFFSLSANKEGWQVYATDSPNHWLVNYRGYYFHIANRIQSFAEMHFDSIRDRISEIEKISLPDNHLLRLRALYYDDKNGNYQWYIDYLYPKDNEPHITNHSVKRILGDGYVLDDGQFHNFDIRSYQYYIHSDHYDPDHYDYYIPFLRDFLIGNERSVQYSMKLPGNKELWISEETENEVFRNNKFNELVDAFKEIDFIEIIRAVNSSIEDIDKFHNKFNWNEILGALDIDDDLFFSAKISFTCSNFKELTLLLEMLPSNVETHFKLSKRYILPFEETQLDDESIYDLVFSLHPAIIKNKVMARNRFNSYFNDIIIKVKSYLD
jgi:hypothetical protein